MPPYVFLQFFGQILKEADLDGDKKLSFEFEHAIFKAPDFVK